jgi:hypothetical protein
MTQIRSTDEGPHGSRYRGRIPLWWEDELDALDRRDVVAARSPSAA